MVENPNAITVVNNNRFVAPVTDLPGALMRYQLQKDFVGSVLSEGVDFGKIPGVEKPSLYKPGAEKLNSFFGLAEREELTYSVEDWDGSEHGGEKLFYYRYKISIWNGDFLVSECEGSANSRESKYRWRWVPESDVPTGMDKSLLKVRDGRVSEFSFAVEKGETSGQYGKPAEYWKQFKDAIAAGTATKTKKKTKKGADMDAWEIGAPLFRIPNDDIESQINTLQKMAQKRAYVGATLLATNASDYFTMDVEDFMVPGDPTFVDVEARDAAPTPQPAQAAKPAAPAPQPAAAPTPASKPAATPAPAVANGNGRPYNPLTVQLKIDELRKKNEAEGKKSGKDTLNTVRTMMELSFAGFSDAPERAKMVLKFLTGFGAFELLPDAEQLALLTMIHPVKDSGGALLPTPNAIIEFAEIYRVESSIDPMFR